MGFSVSISAEIAAQKERLFLWVPVCFGLGIVLYFALMAEPVHWAGFAGIAAVLPFLSHYHKKQHDDAAHFIAYLLSAAIFLAACGFTAAQAGTGFYGTPILEKKIGPVRVVGQIEHIEKLGGNEGSRVVLRNVSLERVEHAPRKVRVKFRKDENLKAGDTISALVSLDSPSMAVLPYAYDFRRHLFFDGIGGVGFAYSAGEVIDSQPDHDLFFENLRTWIDSKIIARAGPVTAGIMSALVTGQRGAIADEDDEAMRDSGLYHLLSISGTHVCMVAGVLFFFVRFFLALFPWAALHWPIKKIAAVAALAGAAFYVVLAGAEVPAVRALMMTGLIMMAIMLDRSPFSLRLIAFAALIVLLLAPHSLIGVSFQMSFAAVAALICFFDFIRPWWMKWYSRAGFVRKSMMYLIATLLTSLIAGSVTGLFSLYHFQAFSLYGVLANIIAVPLTGFIIMPAAIVSLILMPFGAEGFALDVMEWGTMWMLAIAYWTAGLDGAVLRVSQWPQVTFAFIAMGVVLFLLWRGWAGKGAAVLLVIIGLVFAALHMPYDLMVSGTGKLVGVRHGGEVYVSNGRGEKFAAENWLRLNGSGEKKAKTFKDAPDIACDDDGCRIVMHGQNVLLAKTLKAYAEDCSWAQLIVSPIPLKKKECPEARILNLYDFKDEGAHGVRLRHGIDVTSVKDVAGNRPWTRADRRKD